MFDSHVHSAYSHDAISTIGEICRSAVEKGVSGVSVCDHADMWFYEKQHTYEGFRACMAEILEIKERYRGKVKLLQGIEMAEYLFDPIKAEMLYSLGEYDVILGSVHSVLYEDITDAYSRVDFGAMREEKIVGFLREYFAKMKEMIEKTDFDVLTHLTCPLRYINGKYGREISASRFEEEIREIFRLIIEKEIALEINTSGVGTAFGEYMPDMMLVQRYREMGGTMLTIGSDAHTPDRIGYAIPEAKRLLSDMGFTAYYYFEKRKPQRIAL